MESVNKLKRHQIKQKIKDVITSQKLSILYWCYPLIISVFYAYRDIDTSFILTIILECITVGVSFSWLKIMKSQNAVLMAKSFTVNNAFYGIDRLTIIIKYLGLIAYQTFFAFLWTLLFIIPGIYKGILYSMSIFVYHENSENISYKEALATSSNLMRSNIMSYIKLFFSYAHYYIAYITCISVVTYLLQLFNQSHNFVYMIFVLPVIVFSTIIGIYLKIVFTGLRAGFYAELKNYSKLERLS